MSKLKQNKIPINLPDKYAATNVQDKYAEKQNEVLMDMLDEYIVTKLSDDKFEGLHPNFIDKGYTVIGTFTVPPTIGKSFIIQSPRDKNKYLHTSSVTEILDKETFKTQNSTYRLVKVDSLQSIDFKES